MYGSDVVINTSQFYDISFRCIDIYLWYVKYMLWDVYIELA